MKEILMNAMDQLEQRLGDALERIDFSLDQAPRAVEKTAELEERLAAALAKRDQALEEAARAQAGTSPDVSLPAVDDLEARLAQARREAARLAQANESLREANRLLTMAVEADDQIEAIKAGFEAEAATLRAARSAEIAHLADILAELEALLDETKGAVTPSDKPADVEPDGKSKES